MNFKDLNIKIEYRTLLDNMPKEFFVPLLKEAVSYKRAVGYFSSSVLIEISKGILGLVKNGGHIQIITSPNLSDEDLKAIREGYKDRDEVIRNAVFRELRDPVNQYQSDRLNLLANLIADGFLDIKIAITIKNDYIGIYHEKVGILEDKEGNKIAFSGSPNETANALLNNYETVDVFCDWKGDVERVRIKEEAFDRIWNDFEPNLKIVNVENLSDEIIKKYKKEKIDYQKFNDKEDIIPDIERDCTFFKMPDGVALYEYQKEAISNWINKSFCGVYDMATGTGKTYTALASLSKLSQILNENIAVIIVVPYRHLVEQWVLDINYFNVKPIKAYGYPGQNWRKEFYDAVNAYNIGVINNFCIITTNATFSTDDFQNLIHKFKKNFCFVADEAHNLGAEKIGKLLPKKARYRLALSATIERHGDEKGTETLYSYFGKEPCITFTLKEAIKQGFLTPYYYHPVLVCLDDDELEEYNTLTGQIIKAGYHEDDEVEKGSYIELLLIKRARIIAGCRQKVDKLIEIIEPFKEDYHMLIYCGATKYDNSKIGDEGEVRQIDEINKQLYEKLGMKVRKFTSSERIKDRAEITEMFVNEEIQAITAIKCLDEGVNIPSIYKAFILASSTNPKEYIQRRGRVLRKAKGKKKADIYDFITLPRPLEDVAFCDENTRQQDLSLVRREFNRMLDFAETAENPSEIDMLRYDIINTYKIN